MHDEQISAIGPSYTLFGILLHADTTPLPTGFHERIRGEASIPEKHDCYHLIIIRIDSLLFPAFATVSSVFHHAASVSDLDVANSYV
jgi:hypothetical protein